MRIVTVKYEIMRVETVQGSFSMETMIKSIAIFTILCEMLIFLLPNQTYEKYFRFLTNLLLMLLIVESISNWFSPENKETIISQIGELEQEAELSMEGVEKKVYDYYDESE